MNYKVLWTVPILMFLSQACDDTVTLEVRNGYIHDETDSPDHPDTPDNPDTPEIPDPPVEPPELPEIVAEADILDVVFNQDGTAQNIAPTSLTVNQYNRKALFSFYPNAIATYYHSTFNRYVAHFNNPLGGNASAYYRIDYGNYADIVNAISDDHSLEAVFRLDTAHSGTAEAKFFAAHQSGGTGFLISKSEKGQDITFLPHVGGNYIWCGSGIKPEVGKYYHVIGVWDKSSGNAHIYINGELKNTVPAAGELKLGSETWFGIGCDAGPTPNIAWNGEVSIARVYGRALTADEANTLYQKAMIPPGNQFTLQNVDALGTCNVNAGYRYYIYGTGFMTSDTVRFESTTSDKTYTSNITIDSDHATVIIPDDFVTDDYRVVVVRGDDIYPITSGTITMTDKASKQTNVKCVAHRGYHPDSAHPENSIASLKYAQELGVYGSEFDVWISLDGELFINHDSSFKDVTIQTSNASTIKQLTLSNGETIPTLRAYLEQGKKVPSVKMILEIKTHGNVTGYTAAENNKRVTKACIDLVKELGMEDQVEWIAFDYNICKQIRATLPNAVVQYLNGDKSPSSMVADKISAIDYSASNLTDAYITDAHNHNMFVNVWTINDTNDMKTWINKGVDVITTNKSQDLMKLLRVYVEPGN